MIWKREQTHWMLVWGKTWQQKWNYYPEINTLSRSAIHSAKFFTQWKQRGLIRSSTKCSHLHKKKQPGGVGTGFKSSLPIDGEQLKGSRLVTHRASPRGLLLVHLQEKDCVETLKVGAGQNSTRYTEPHLHQLGDREGDTGSELSFNDATGRGSTSFKHRHKQAHTDVLSSYKQEAWGCTHGTDEGDSEACCRNFALWIKS